jgi:hypothetical protein
VDREVVAPVRYQKQLEIPPSPASVSVSGRNRMSLILGSALAGGTFVFVVTTIGLYYAPVSTSSSTQPKDFWPLTFSLASGMAFPAVYYLLKIGKNEARVVPFAAP